MSAASPDDLSGWPVGLEVYRDMPDSTMLRVPLGMLRRLAASPTPAQRGSSAALAGRLQQILAARAPGQLP